MNFKSDNVVPVCPSIMDAIVSANKGFQGSYGTDDYSKKLQVKLSEFFEKEVLVFFTSTGTAANSLSVSSLINPYSIIYSSDQAHINTDECGAPEFFTGGAKLSLISSSHGKIDSNELNKAIYQDFSLRPRRQKPGCISITQSTELGTVYTKDQLHNIASIAKQHSIPIHMDGARFANALVSLGLKPAEITWKVGVDVLSFGATKNGALCAEAVVFFNHKYAKDFDYLLKRAGQNFSKARFMAAQFLVYLEDDLWFKNAKKANESAKALAKIFTARGFEIVYPVEANEVFVKMNPTCAGYLNQSGVGFYPWGDPAEYIYRFVTSFYTQKADLEAFDKCLQKT